MIERPGRRRRAWVRALGSALMIVGAARVAQAVDEAPGPAWLRDPLTRGPLAASLGLDPRHTWWGVDGTIPLNLGTPPVPTGATSQPVLGLGLSIAGQAGSGTRSVRYSALVDRARPSTGEWLGVSTGGGSQGLDTRLQFGTGLWRSLAPIEIEAGMVSSFVGYQRREASHWGFYRDSLHWRDTTTYQNVDRSGIWHTAHGAVRWRNGRMELTAIGGITVGQRIEPRRWAQAMLDIRASRRLKVMAAYGRRPAASMAFDRSAPPQAMLAFQVAPWASREPPSLAAVVPRAREWSTRPLGDRTVCSVRCPDATQVEITGDFTDWAPVALSPAGRGRWETTLAIAAGLHQVQIRLDGGEWQVPPGLPSTQHEFAGTVGVLLIDGARP